MIAQFPQDLVHLESCGQRLDQNSRFDGADRKPGRLFGIGEHVVPNPRLETCLDFGEVEIGPAASAEGIARIVEKVEPEVEQRRGDRLAVHREVLLDKVPAAWANDQDCGFLR